MKRKWAAPLAASTIAAMTLLFGTAVVAAIDLSDFDDDVMRAMDDAAKDLEPALGGGDVTAAKNDIDVLLEGYQWVEDYFIAKGDVTDAIKIAKDGRALVVLAQQALAKKDLATAAAAARDTTKNCKSCHDLYKPLTK